MRLRFPPLAGGVIQGLNDAGIETFEGDYPHYVVRESAQNSLDAAASLDHAVRIEINVHSLPVEELPFFGDLRETLRACKTFWHGQPKPVEFFDRALSMARHKSIYVLRVADYGTTGVPGGDMDMNEPWFGLVRSRGVSIKTDEASAGAFGIGKDAPLAASAFRTVLYSTRTSRGDVAIQGICRLASHKNGKDLTQGSGFICRRYRPKTNRSWIAMIFTSQSWSEGRLRGRGGSARSRLTNTLTNRTMFGPRGCRRGDGVRSKRLTFPARLNRLLRY
jgi:hypothetical protein